MPLTIRIKENLTSVLLIAMCVGVLAAIAIPCFIGARELKQRSAVKGNMRDVQIAAETYATENNGRYPEKLSQIEPFLPAGVQILDKRFDTMPMNPVTGSRKDSLVLGSVLKSENMIAELRARDIGDSSLKPGQIAYCAVAGGNTYAILGSGPDGMQIAGSGGKVLVLSNQ